MKKVLIIIILIISIPLFTGCEDWLDVNQDPNNMVDQPAINETIYLIGVEGEWAWKSQSCFSWWFYAEDTQWLLWEAMPGANSSSFVITPNFGTIVWRTYSDCLKHAMNLYDKAKENGNRKYQAIAAVIAAWNWFYLTDMYDQVPLDEALKGFEFAHPKVATQEQVYARANGLLDEAIALFQDPNEGTLVPTAKDDYMMGADWDKWIRLCYSLKARQAMRLAYAPGKTTTGQADAVLAALANGMTSNSDECKWNHATDPKDNWSWCYNDYLTSYSGKGQISCNWQVDLMNSLNDPRRYVMFTFSQYYPDGFEGMQSGGTFPHPGYDPSFYKQDFVGPTHPDYIMRYPECLFLKAEAYVLKQDWANAQSAFEAAVTADMRAYSIPEDFPQSIPQDSITKYLAQPALTLEQDIEKAQEQIMIQKYIAGIYNSKEAYFDYIRTGYPKFDFPYALRNVTTDVTFPRRFMYPTDQITNNENIIAVGQKDPLKFGTAWDAKPGIGPRATR